MLSSHAWSNYSSRRGAADWTGVEVEVEVEVEIRGGLQVPRSTRKHNRAHAALCDGRVRVQSRPKWKRQAVGTCAAVVAKSEEAQNSPPFGRRTAGQHNTANTQIWASISSYTS